MTSTYCSYYINLKKESTERSKSFSIKCAMTVETNVVGLQHIWRVFK
jgi:hypothetical protein